MANDWHQLSLLIYCVCLHLSIAVVTVVGVVVVVGGCIIVEGARCIRLLRPSTIMCLVNRKTLKGILDMR